MGAIEQKLHFELNIPSLGAVTMATVRASSAKRRMVNDIMMCNKLELYGVALILRSRPLLCKNSHFIENRLFGSTARIQKFISRKLSKLEKIGRYYLSGKDLNFLMVQTA